MGLIGWIILIIVVVLIFLLSLACTMDQYHLGIKVDNAWSQIDVQLQRRFDLIPNFVETVKGYVAHENEKTLEKVTSFKNIMGKCKYSF